MPLSWYKFKSTNFTNTNTRTNSEMSPPSLSPWSYFPDSCSPNKAAIDCLRTLFVTRSFHQPPSFPSTSFCTKPVYGENLTNMRSGERELLVSWHSRTHQRCLAALHLFSGRATIITRIWKTAECHKWDSAVFCHLVSDCKQPEKLNLASSETSFLNNFHGKNKSVDSELVNSKSDNTDPYFFHPIGLQPAVSLDN